MLKKYIFTLCLLSIFSSCLADDDIVSDSINDSAHQRALSKFFNAVEVIKRNYVQSVSEEQLYDNAIKGMVNGLDPHSTYLNKEDLKFLTDTTSGAYVGVGLELTQEDHITKIISALDDSPAQAANVKPGDIILKINNMAIDRLALQDVIRKMQGPPNSTLTLTLYRQGKRAPFSVQLVRKSIQLKSVKSQLLKPGYGYIRIAYFQENTADETEKAIDVLKRQSDGKLDGIIIDLRNNPGGLLDSAINVTDHFINGRKPIVSARGRTPESKFAIDASATDLTNNAPIVVLINSGSASGAEIVAGALQDYHRAIIMGQSSFGKGSVQTVIPLDGSSALKLTTSLYYTPSGRSIQAKGIVPDIKVEDKMFAKNTNTTDSFELKESELPGHLTVNKEDPAQTTNMKKKTDILASDYQVQEALQLLEGLNTTRKTEKV